MKSTHPGPPRPGVVHEAVSGRGVTNAVIAESALAACQQHCHHLRGAAVRCGPHTKGLLCALGTGMRWEPAEQGWEMKGDERENLEVSLGCQELFTPNKRRCRTQTCRQQKAQLGSLARQPCLSAL